MGKVQGYFIGYRQFAVDRNWLREQEEARYQERQRKFEQWSKEWITVTRLKTDRLWTDWAIKKWLGKPKKRGEYNVFPVADVKAVENKKEFKDWHDPRIKKKLSTHQYFSIPKL
ncbi:hypothetical protein [Citrobacter braakii]|uniref:hypothetical protein n=1 Tax=Citrobacter braakii TaxID=57706 RepID=UPI004039A1D8